MLYKGYMFQYISCYSLSKRTTGTQESTLVSIHLMLLFINVLSGFALSPLCFNTSHVTLYPDVYADEIMAIIKFQYISCYSLSRGSSSVKGE